MTFHVTQPSDIVERLREVISPTYADDAREAAAEIEQLRIELKASQTGVAALQGTVERLRIDLMEAKAVANIRLEQIDRLQAIILSLGGKP